MTDLMLRCIGAAQVARACEDCYERRALLAKNGWNVGGCTDCTANVVRAVLDEFIREPATEALGKLAVALGRSSAWMARERELLREIFAAQRRMVEE